MSPSRAALAVLASGAFALGLGASDARPAKTTTVTISMLALANYESAYDVLIPNFERVYPNITVNITYAHPITVLDQIEVTELAAGTAPDLLSTNSGCGTIVAICQLAPAEDLAPLVKAPWVKRSLPLVTSADKHGQGLFAFTPAVSPYGMFTNDALFAKLDLKMPQTFSELLGVCKKAEADGTTAVLFAGGTAANTAALVTDLAVATLYAQDKQWTGELKAGKATFAGTPGWQQALQEFIDMNNAGCFQPGATGTSGASAEAEFAQGQGLMFVDFSTSMGSIVMNSPQFTYTFHPFPGGTDQNKTSTFLNFNLSVSVNAHSSPQNQAAAQTFIDFIARPKQNALYAQTTGGLTQYEFLKGQIPPFMSSFATVFAEHDYLVDPRASWWNANVLLTLETDTIGLITGQETIDDILNAMDAAWKQGPS